MTRTHAIRSVRLLMHRSAMVLTAIALAMGPGTRAIRAQDAPVATGSSAATVFGPNFDLESVLAREAQVVFLPWQDYEELRDFGKKAQVELIPPFAWAYGQASYELTAGDQAARCRATYEILVLEEGWHQVPVPAGDIVFQKALLDGRETYLAPIVAGPTTRQEGAPGSGGEPIPPGADAMAQQPANAVSNTAQATNAQVQIFQNAYRLPPVYPGQSQVLANQAAQPSMPSSNAAGMSASPGVQAGSYAVSVPTTGTHTLVLELVVPVVESGGGGAGGRALGMAIPRTPIGAVSAILPVADAAVGVGSGIGRRIAREGDHTRVSFLLPPCDRLDLSWTGHVEEQRPEGAGLSTVPEPEAPPRLDGEVHATYRINEYFVSATAAVYFSVRQGQVPGFSIKLPKDAELTDLVDMATGHSALYDVKKDDDGTTTYRVTLEAPARGQRRYRVEFDRPVVGPPQGKAEGKPEGSDETPVNVEVPLVELPGTEVERGDFVLTRSPEIEIIAGKQEHVTPVTVAELPRDPIFQSGGTSDLAFHYSMHHPSLSIDCRALHPAPQISCVVDRELGHTVITDEGMAFTRLRYSIRNTGQKYLEVSIPDHGTAGARTPASVLSVLSDGEPVRPGEQASDKEPGFRTLVVPLRLGVENREASFELEIVYAGSLSGPLGDRGSLVVPLPRTRLLSKADLMISRLVWVVDMPGDTQVHSFKTDMSPSEQKISSQELAAHPVRGPEATLEKAPLPANALANVLRNLRPHVAGISPVASDWPELAASPLTRGQFEAPSSMLDQRFSIGVSYCSTRMARTVRTLVFVLVLGSLVVGGLMGLLWGWALFPIVAVLGGWMAGGHPVWMAIVAAILLGLVKLVITPAQERTTP